MTCSSCTQETWLSPHHFPKTCWGHYPYCPQIQELYGHYKPGEGYKPYCSLGGTFYYIKDWVNPAKNCFLIQLLWHSTLFFRSNLIYFFNCFSFHLFINSPCAILTNQKALCSHKALSVQNSFLCLHAVSFIHGRLHSFHTFKLPLDDVLLSCSSPHPLLQLPCSFITLQFCERSGWTCESCSHESEDIQY